MRSHRLVGAARGETRPFLSKQKLLSLYQYSRHQIAEAHASIAEFGSKEKTWEAERNEMTTVAALATVMHEKAVQEAEAAMAELQGKVTGLEATVERLEADLAAKIEVRARVVVVVVVFIVVVPLQERSLVSADAPRGLSAPFQHPSPSSLPRSFSHLPTTY